MTSFSVQEGGRAAALSRALRQAARKFRTAGSSATVRGNVVLVQRRWETVFAPALKIGFLVIVVAPLLAAALYFGLIASDRYVATAQFTVRSGQQSSTLLNELTTYSREPVQNTGVVANYIGSNDMIAALQRRLDLRAIYDRPQADYFSRISTEESAEDFNRYWNRHIDVSVDSVSNIVTVSVDAFTPQDAHRVARAILQESESLVNRMSERARGDALRDSQSELAGVERVLDIKTNAVRKLRDQSGLIDPKVTNDAAAAMLGTLRTNLADLRIEYATQLRYVRPDAPQMTILSRRIADTERQIATSESQLAGSSTRANPTLAAAAEQFDKAMLELGVAQQQYAAGAVKAERARVALEEKQIYVLSFAQPTLPEEALYPRRLLSIGIVAAACLALYAALAGLAVLARNNLAV